MSGSQLAVLLAAVVLLRSDMSVQEAAGKTQQTAGRILKLEELSWPEIDQIDRKKSVFFLTFGNLEEHGPQLPVGSDYFEALALRDGLINRLRKAHPNYDIVLFPVLPIGEGGANALAMQFDHIGTFSVRFETLRNLAIDLGASIARKGFQNIFVVHFHGVPLHNIALTEASDFVSERYKVRMVNVTSMVLASAWFSPTAMQKYLGKDWEEKIGWEGHAGAAETSMNLYLHSSLVKNYKRMPPFVAKDYVEVFKTSERQGWQGYWGDPSRASHELGKDLLDDFVDRAFQMAQKVLAGEDLSSIPVYPYNQPPLKAAEPRNRMVSEEYAKQAAEIQGWTSKRPKQNP
jgi:creatinine amidohydrolase